MTRINCIPVTELTDKHLLAEYRELPRVFALARPCEDAPKEYTMGAGHVKFFYNKLAYLYSRQISIHAELQKRGFKLTYSPYTLFEKWFPVYKNTGLWRNWDFSHEEYAKATAINRERIQQRLKEKENVL